MEMTISKIRRLLEALVQMSEEDGLTGVYRGDARPAIQRYNSIFEYLEDEDILPEGLFSRLDENDGFARLATDARLLLSFLSDEGRGEPTEGRHERWDIEEQIGALLGIAPFAPKEELGRLVRDLLGRGGSVNTGMLIGLAPFLDREDVGQIMRIAVQGHPTPVTPPSPPSHPSHPTPPSPPTPPAVAEGGSLVRDASSELRRLSDELATPDISPERRAEIAVELARIAHEQAARSERM